MRVMTGRTRACDRAESGHMPTLTESAEYIRELGKPTVRDVLCAARAGGRVALQPRCGVGSHDQMLQLLRDLDEGAHPDILSVTIDSHTRLLDFDAACRALASDPARLNGYPLVTHG